MACGSDIVSGRKKVAIVEKDITAGTCTNYGCSAKFLLDSPFEFIDSLSRYDKAGITGNTKVNWQELMAYKKSEIPTYASLMEGMFAQMQIDLLKGYGKLVDAHTVSVDDDRISADYIVLGTVNVQHVFKLKGKNSCMIVVISLIWIRCQNTSPLSVQESFLWNLQPCLLSLAQRSISLNMLIEL